jgi:hypothetical protein
VVFSYGWESGGVAGVPPGSTRVEIVLDEHAGWTRLWVVHSQLPSGVAEEHRYGWRFFPGRLAQRGEGRAAPVDCQVQETERAG